MLNRRIAPSDAEIGSAMRVFVQFQSFQDHVTITFYIDAGKRFGGLQFLRAEEGFGRRRSTLAGHLDCIRRSCHEQIVTGAIDMPSVPGLGNSELAAAAGYLFEGIWAEFQNAFNFALEPQDGKDASPFLNEGVVFVNHRGLLMSIRGLDTEEDAKRKEAIEKLARRNGIAVRDELVEREAWRPLGRAANATLGPVDVFDEGSSEPEVVLKSLWPYLCEMTADAARKDWVGCGILEWRALFMSTLGARASGAADNDRAAPAESAHKPERFLIVTKGEPHRKQIGRFVERLVSLETTRAIAFKNLGAIQNAHLHLRTLTMELDDILEKWANDRQRIQSERGGRTPAPPTGGVLDILTPEEIRREEEFYKRLSDLNEEYETRLINIAALLEKIGPGGSGHLAQSIDEAIYYYRRVRPHGADAGDRQRRGLDQLRAVRRLNRPRFVGGSRS